MKFTTAVVASSIFAVSTIASETTLGDTIIAPKSELYTAQSHPQEYCMALNVYHESRSDNLAGQFAVADVVLNRVRDSRWPNTVCEVITEGPISKWWKEQHGKEIPVRHKCQFSWYCDGKNDNPRDEEAWRRAQTVAYQIMNRDMMRGISEGANHYHATYVDPSWNKRFRTIGRIGAHVFYRAE
jgi:N-acetylmuramoyl-L-alanine amidase